jgi:hypothetical protein
VVKDAFKEKEVVSNVKYCVMYPCFKLSNQITFRTASQNKILSISVNEFEFSPMGLKCYIYIKKLSILKIVSI